MDSQQQLARNVSQVWEPGVDPYNTADRLKADRERETLFVEWLTNPEVTTHERVR